MIIIGHRGAAGMAPENTIPSIEAAVAEEVDMVEIDIQATKDGHLIVFHDDNLLRLAGKNVKIADLSLKDINMTGTHSGHPIPSFREAMEAAGKTPVLIDCKGKDWAKILLKELKNHTGPTPAVTSRNRTELFEIMQARPDIETYVSELTHPLDAIYTAKTLGLTGISLNFWVLNPLSYFYARRTKRKIMVFAINTPFFARFVHFLYPQVAIITNVPHKMARLSARRQYLKTKQREATKARRRERLSTLTSTKRSRSRRLNTGQLQKRRSNNK